jgi:hypothetical protein
LDPLSTARSSFKVKFRQNALAGPRDAVLSLGIYAAPFPNAFIIPRCQRLAFSPVFVLLLSPLLRLFSFSRPPFCRTPGPSTSHDTHKHGRDAHSRSRPFSHSSISLSLSSTTLATLTLARFSALTSSSVFLVLFIFYIIAAVRPLSPARVQTDIETTPSSL